MHLVHFKMNKYKGLIDKHKRFLTGHTISSSSNCYHKYWVTLCYKTQFYSLCNKIISKRGRKNSVPDSDCRIHYFLGGPAFPIKIRPSLYRSAPGPESLHVQLKVLRNEINVCKINFNKFCHTTFYFTLPTEIGFKKQKLWRKKLHFGILKTTVLKKK